MSFYSGARVEGIDVKYKAEAEVWKGWKGKDCMIWRG